MRGGGISCFLMTARGRNFLENKEKKHKKEKILNAVHTNINEDPG
jgi:hypothetical protein